MLIEFTVGNYRSFLEPVTLSLEATKLTSQDKSLDENTVFTVDDDLRLLTSAAVYGANAGGKSNLAAAMKFMQEFVQGSSKDTQAGEKIPVEPFALNPESMGKPSSFEMVFRVEGRQYRYGFEATAERIEREWLYHVPGIRETRLFTRERQEITIATAAFKEGKGVEEKTRENALFLSVVAQFNGTIALSLINWFHLWIPISGLNDYPSLILTKIYLDSPILAAEVISLVKSFDVSIDNLRVELPEADQGGTATGLAGDLKKASRRPKFLTTHRAYNTNGEPAPAVEFDCDTQESEGTKKMIALASFILHSLYTGTLLVIDEFDARLHPSISREIVRMYNSTETNPKHAQLIFFTHDTNLLDRKLLRRDQIWFVEKDRVGASHLYSLAEFKVRYDASYEQDYIKGKYGAIPFLGDIRRAVEGFNG